MVLLIGGHPRSGTTMLCALCNGHPDLAVTIEFGAFRILNVPLPLYTLGVLGRIWFRRNRPVLADTNGAGTMARLRKDHRMMWAFLRAVRRRRPPLVRIADIEAALREAIPGAPRIVGDKYPNYVFTLPAYVGLEGVRPVVIFRDARDVAASYLERWRTRGRRTPVFGQFDTAEKIARHWVWAVETMRLHEARVHTIRYEALVRTPRPVLDALGAYLDVDPAGFPAEILHDRSVGRYAERLTAEECATVERIAGPLLDDLGYR